MRLNTRVKNAIYILAGCLILLSAISVLGSTTTAHAETRDYLPVESYLKSDKLLNDDGSESI